MALKLKGKAAPKAGPKKARAKRELDEIRQAIEENTVAPRKGTRRSGRVRRYSAGSRSKPLNGYRALLDEMERFYQLRMPQGLSIEAQWMEQRAEGYCPLDWWALFDTDKELWPYIMEEVLNGN